MPIFRVKSVKIYTGKKNLHEYIRGVRDKYPNMPLLVVKLALNTTFGPWTVVFSPSLVIKKVSRRIQVVQKRKDFTTICIQQNVFIAVTWFQIWLWIFKF